MQWTKKLKRNGFEYYTRYLNINKDEVVTWREMPPLKLYFLSIRVLHSTLNKAASKIGECNLHSFIIRNAF